MKETKTIEFLAAVPFVVLVGAKIVGAVTNDPKVRKYAKATEKVAEAGTLLLPVGMKLPKAAKALKALIWGPFARPAWRSGRIGLRVMLSCTGARPQTRFQTSPGQILAPAAARDLERVLTGEERLL